MFTSIAVLLISFSKGQEISSWFIDSLAERHNICKTLLLFAEHHDTTDALTGKAYSQRIAFYYDRIHKQVRDVDVYDFNEKINPKVIHRVFAKQKNVPVSTHIIYTFFNCSLVKVKVMPPETDCKECSGEYYFNNNELFSKREKNIKEQKRDFITEANFYFKKLEMADTSFTRCTLKSNPIAVANKSDE